jgi:glutamate-ammonia-ligase adenylyltransferase
VTPHALRQTSGSGRLARLGFTDPDVAARRLHSMGLADPPENEVLAAVAAAADPDLALAALDRLLGAATDRLQLLAALREQAGLRQRLIGVLGASAALGEHLARHPVDWWVLADERAAAVRPSRFGLESTMRAAVRETEPLDALRLAYRRCLLDLAARDLTGALAVEEVAGELADLAGATLSGALALARAQLPADAEPCRLAVVGLGKCGGRELNYVSDVDVIFVSEPEAGGDETAALRTATTLASGLIHACSTVTAEGGIWPVDTALRPEGRAGPLVRTLASHEAYYRRWAKTWEFQALVKARPVAGDLDLGRAYLDRLRPLVWSAAERPGFVDDVQAMRRRVESALPRAGADRELKLGPGGLRDIEFAVQLLQLVHGRSDSDLHSGTTLTALAALAAGGYVGRADAAGLAAAYRFLRTVEHRLQLQRLRRTHKLPTDPAQLRWLARSLGYRADPVAALTAEHAAHAREVRRLHEKLFYRPLLGAVARLPAEEARLTPAAAGRRLEALGFRDPVGALRHLEVLTAGVSRRSAIQRTLLPVMLGWFADAPDPDAGLLSFRQVSDSLGSTHWYLRLLRDEGVVAERLARLLATSRYAADLLGRAPEAVALLAGNDELQPRSATELQTEMRAAVRRHHDDPEAAVVAVRALRRRELLRIACADLLGLADVVAVGPALADSTVAALVAALDAATRAVETERGAELPARLLVVAVGRLGGRESGYGSDADVLFVHEPLPGTSDAAAAAGAHQVFEELRRLLSVPAHDPPLGVDADLRPEGRQGPLTRSLASYAAYYSRWSSPWEAQALLRALPCAGDPGLRERFTDVIAPVRWPVGGIDAAAVREIRRLKARVEAERLPRGADPALHTKLGRGGLADVEWTVQLLQLRYAGAEPALRATGTLEALRAAAAAGVLGAQDAATLEAAWRTATRVRNAIMLARGRPADAVPTDVRELAGVARVVGYPAGRSVELLEDYRRVTRRARAVVERVFYG